MNNLYRKILVVLKLKLTLTLTLSLSLGLVFFAGCEKLQFDKEPLKNSQLFIDADLILRKFTPPAMKQFELSSNDIGTHIDEISHRIRFPTFMENIKEVIETGVDFEKEIQKVLIYLFLFCKNDKRLLCH